MLSAWTDLAYLCLESQHVMALRWVKLAAGGPAAQLEANRMVTEKLTAAWSAACEMAGGATPETVVRGYRRKVRANMRRLSR